jgi:hypothetical protein
MSSLTQDQVFQNIQGKIKRKYEDEKAFSSGVITKLLKELYDSNLQGPLVFYSQDENGLPIEKIAARIAGEKRYCTVASKSVFEVKDWQNRSKSADYLGHWHLHLLKILLGISMRMTSASSDAANVKRKKKSSACADTMRG